MRYIQILFAVVVVFAACSGQKEQIVLTDDLRSDYTIVVSDKADKLTKLAVGELRNYIHRMTCVKLKIENRVIEGKKSIFAGKELIIDPRIHKDLATLDEDGFIIRTIDKNIMICGNNGKSNIYAAYTFIEEFLGCRLLASDEEYIPDNRTVKIPEINRIYEPAFSFRRILFPGLSDEKYRFWHKIETLDEWGSFVHTFNKLIPPEKYFEKHPEYFSLIGSVRLRDAQLCLSNPAVINTLKENLGKEIKKNRDKKYWSVSQNDCINYCECDNCKKMYENLGGVSGVYVFMANEIAKEFPDKQISTLAYQFTRSAPKNIIPLKNVNIMLCSIECNRSMPLADDIRSGDFVKDMKDWSDLTNNIFIWDYVVQFKNYLTPFPNFNVLQPNIQFFKKNNVTMMFQQGSNRNWSDLGELKQYLISKLLWNPDADVDEMVNDFMDKYYGPARSYIRSYYDISHKALDENREEEFLNIYGFPSDYSDSFLTPALLKKYKELMDKAERSVKKDPKYLKRVLRARLPVDFAYLDTALNKNSDEISWLDKKGDNVSIRTDMLEYLDRFVEISGQTGVTRINARNFLTEDYRKYVLDKLKRMIRNNIVKKKNLRSLTKWSDKYPVGGEKALTDGLFGDLDFHNNWLGYEGNDMIVEIDLHKAETISQVSMNFLKAVNSWVFLPVEVVVEVSEDGVNYKKAGSLKGDIKDKNYLVKSVPFNVNIDPVSVQYLRIKAISLKKCPEWHRGFGNPSWIFVDELIVE
ncbi:MAG: DUF4838 domain-containing protein [Acidobacteriota bacterium]